MHVNKKQKQTSPEEEVKKMKKMRMNVEERFHWMIAAFLFCLSGGLIQIIAPAFPNIAAVMGIVFFALTAALGVMIWKLRLTVRKDRAAIARFQARRRRAHRAV